MCAENAGSDAGCGSASNDEVWERSKHLEVLELRADEVIEVARAASSIRSLRELRDHTQEVQGKEIRTRRAMKTLEQICCDPRLIIALMLYAADHPDWAWVNFWAAFCPDMTMRQMARLRKINVSTVRMALQNCALPRDAYEFVPEDR